MEWGAAPTARSLTGAVHRVCVWAQEVVQLGEVVDQVLRTLLPTAGSVTLEKVVHARLPPLVGDRRRLVLVLTELVGNAVRFAAAQQNTTTKVRGSLALSLAPSRGGDPSCSPRPHHNMPHGMRPHPQGRVTVKAYPDRGARHVVIKVVDDGPGLTTQHLEQLNNNGKAAAQQQVRSSSSARLDPWAHGSVGAPS